MQQPGWFFGAVLFLGRRHLGSKEDYGKTASTMASHPLTAGMRPRIGLWVPACVSTLPALACVPQTVTQLPALSSHDPCRPALDSWSMLAGRHEARSTTISGRFWVSRDPVVFSPLNWLGGDISGGGRRACSTDCYTIYFGASMRLMAPGTAQREGHSSSHCDILSQDINFHSRLGDDEFHVA